MNLHDDKQVFEDTINAISRRVGLDTAIIEKDYYVTRVLRELAERVPGLVFKGGTSLSKCYKIIDRFSEDIDITLKPEYQTQGKKKRLKYAIVDICKDLRVVLLNEEETRSRRDFNRYKIDYWARFNSSELNPLLIVETTFIVKAFPSETRQASSIIYDYLKEMGNEEAIEYYNLAPFDIQVQTLERTFADKVFALCDYMIENRVKKHSRHIYDLYKLLDYVKLNDDLSALIKEVRKSRQAGTKCFSAQDGVNVPELLKEMVDTNFFKEDYERCTEGLLSKPVTYDEAITAIVTIAQSGLFET